MRIFLIGSVVVLLCLNELAFAPPAPQSITMPGRVVGSISVRWLGPNVSASERMSGDAGSTVVTWFDASGKVKEEISESVTLEPGFVVGERNGRGIVRGVNRDWEMSVPQKHGYITGTPDSRFVIQQFSPDEEHIAAEIYEDGKLRATIGPYLNYLGNDIDLGDDGSIAVLTWKTDEKRVPQVVVVGSDGKEKLRVECDGPVASAFPAPNAAGVLLQRNDGSGTYLFFDATGKRSLPSVGDNARFVAWLPGTTTALMQSSIGYDYGWALVDCHLGKSLWKIHHPNAARPEWTGTAVAFTKDYVLFAEQEIVRDRPMRTIYALDIESGNVKAHWLPTHTSYPMIGGQTFLTLGERLYLLTDSECSEIQMDEIAAHKGGWN